MPQLNIENKQGDGEVREKQDSDAEGYQEGFYSDERGYLNQVRSILKHGKRKGDRTGTGVLSVFGSQARYSLRGESCVCVYHHI